MAGAGQTHLHLGNLEPRASAPGLRPRLKDGNQGGACSDPPPTPHPPPPPPRASHSARHLTREQYRHVDQMQLTLPKEVRLGCCPLPGRARTVETNASTWSPLLREKTGKQHKPDSKRCMRSPQPLRPQFTEILVQDSPTVQRGATKAPPWRPQSPCVFPSLPEKGQ